MPAAPEGCARPLCGAPRGFLPPQPPAGLRPPQLVAPRPRRSRPWGAGVRLPPGASQRGASPGLPPPFGHYLGVSPPPPSQSAGRQPPGPAPSFPRSASQWSPPQPTATPRVPVGGGGGHTQRDTRTGAAPRGQQPRLAQPQGLPAPPPLTGSLLSSGETQAKNPPALGLRRLLPSRGGSALRSSGPLCPWASGPCRPPGPGEPEPTTGTGQAANSHFLPAICPR